MKAIFSYLHDFQYSFVLCDRLSNCLHYVSFSHETSIVSKDKLKDCQNITQVIEQGKRYVILFIFVFIYHNVYNQR